MSNFKPAVPHFAPMPYMGQADLLALFDRILPDYYLAPLKSPGPGYEYLQAVAKLNARASEAIAHIGTGSYIGSATGGTYATSTVEFYRDNVLFGAVTLLKGTIVGTSDGYLYQTVADVSFGATDLGPFSVGVQALARGWNWNKPGPITTAAGAVVPGSITRLVTPVVPPTSANFDPTIQVRQLTDAAGGSSPMLDGLGMDRGIIRSETYATVQLERSLPATAQIIVLAGSRLQTADGYLYRTLDPVTFGAGDVGPYTVRAAPLLPTTQAAIDSHGLIASGTGGLELIKWGGVNEDATLAVKAGSQTAYSKETDEAYRTRITFLPDTVTPAALRKVVDLIIGPTLTPLGLAWASREIWDIRYQGAYSETSTGTGPLDFPVNQTLNTAEIAVPVDPYSSNIFVYDYAPTDPLSNRYLETGASHGQIVFALPMLSSDKIGAIYPGLVESLEQVKPAGVDLAFVLVP